MNQPCYFLLEVPFSHCQVYAILLYYNITSGGLIMTATVRLSKSLEEKLNHIAQMLHKKKSDVIREAIEYYADNLENDKKRRLLSAVEKTKHADKKDIAELEETLNDGL